jgi:hypothetical protein
MITHVVEGDVMDTPHKHIAFAINTEGFNDSGFAGFVSKIAPKLANTGPKKLGEVITINAGHKTFHGLVCHSLAKGGWKDAPEAIVQCLNSIEVDDREPIAIIAIGSGEIGRILGASFVKNIRAINRSKKNCVVYVTTEFQKMAADDVINNRC